MKRKSCLLSWCCILGLGLVVVSSAMARDFCRVLSVESAGGDDYEISLSLEGLPEGQVFLSGELYQDLPWVRDTETDRLSIVDNNNGTATAMVYDWPAGEYFKFSYGRGIWSPTKEGWMDPECSLRCCEEYEHDGYSRVKLGVKPPIDFNVMGSMIAARSILLSPCRIPATADTGDNMILGVDDLGEGKYRLYFNFDGLIGSQKFFMGEKAPVDAWKKKSVQRVKKCQVVDIDWDYPSQKIHFSWYAEDGENQHWADAEGGGSKYATCLDGSGHKQFCLDPAQVVADLAGNH